MKLNKQQKKYIDKNIGKKSLKQICQKLKLNEYEINEYLTKKNKKIEQLKIDNIKDNSLFTRIKLFSFKAFIKENKNQFLILLGLVFVSYINALNNLFLSDDIDGIVLNKKLEHFDYFFEGFPPNLQKLLYFLIYSVFGRNPFFFRIFNNFIPHILVIAAVYIFVYLLEKKRIAFITATIFAVHPILTESVVWISAGSYPRYSLFILLALIFFILSEKQKKYFWWSMGSLLISLSFSEKAIMFPLLLIPLIYIFGIGKKNIKKLIILAIPAVGFGILLMSRISDRFLVIGQEGALLNPINQIPIAISSYLGLIFWPDKLTLYHSEMFFSTSQFILMLLVFLIYVSLMIYFIVKKKQIGFWLSFLLITLSPTLTPFGISWIVAERYVYLGSLGIFVLVAYFLDYLRKKNEIIFYFLFSLILILMIGRTIVRNTDWKNMDNLALSSEKISPNSCENLNNLGIINFKKGTTNKAIEYMTKAISICPDGQKFYINLGVVYRKIGSQDLAIQNYEKALQIDQNNSKIWGDLALSYQENGNLNMAISSNLKAISLDPDNLNYLNLAGSLYFQNKDDVNARIYVEKVLNLDPKNLEAKLILQKLDMF